MPLSLLKTQLNSAVKDDELTLVDNLIPGFGDFSNELFEKDSITVRESHLKLEDDRLELSGVSDLPLWGQVPICVEFTYLSDQLHFKLDATLPEARALEIPSFRVTNLSLSFSNQPEEEIEGALTGDIRLFNGAFVKVSLGLPVIPDSWYFSMEAAPVDIPDLKTMGEWIGLANIVDFLPEGMGAIEGLQLSGFNVVFNPSEKSVDYLGLGISAKKFQILPELLNLEEANFSLQVSSPFQAENRSVSLGIGAAIMIQAVSLPVSLERSGDGDWSLYLQDTFSHEVPSLSDLISNFGGAGLIAALPPQVTAITNLRINELGVEFNEKTRVVHSLSLGISNEEWTIIPDHISVNDSELKLAVHQPFSEARTIQGEVSSTLMLGDVVVYLRASLSDTFAFEGSIPEIPLTILLKELLGDVKLPDLLPDLSFEDISVAVTPSKGDFVFSGKSKMVWTLGNENLECSVDLTISRSESNLTCSVGVTATGPVMVATDVLTFNSASLVFNLNADKTWAISADSSVKVFEHSLAFKARFEKGVEGQQLTLSSTHETEKALLKITGVASINYREIGIVIEKPVASDVYGWTLYADGGMQIEPALRLDGRIDLVKAAGAFELIFKPREAKLNLPIFPKQGNMKQDIEGVLSLEGFSFKKTTDQWHLQASGSLTLNGLPIAVNRLLNPSQPEVPFKIDSTFKINHKGAEVSVKSPFHFPVPFPDITIDKTPISVGTGAIGISELSLKIGSSIDLTTRLGIALPQKTNFIFGSRPDGNPNFELFKTYITEDFVNSSFDIGLTVGTGGISANLYSSPLKQDILTIQRKDGSSYCDFDFGELGALLFVIPEFKLDFATSSLQAKGGFRIHPDKPLSLPLGPLKKLLEGLGAKVIGDALPSKLPLKGVSIYDEARQEFKHDELIALLNSLSENSLPKEVAEAIREVSKYSNLLPDALKPYLNFEIPQSLFFHVEVTPDLSLKCNFSVYDPSRPKEEQAGIAPIKMLMPGSPTSLLGIQLYGFSIGQLWSGALLLAEVDFISDQFDMIEMAASLVASAVAGDDNPLASSKDIHKRFMARNVFVPIIYQAGVPIPIPLFYDQIGFETTTAVGGNVQGHIGFPRPQLSITELLKALVNVKEFIVNKDYFFKPEDKPEGLDLKVQLPNNFLKLPKYLGGHVLGHQGDFEISGYQIATKTLNFLKRTSLKDIVEIIPLEHRRGQIGGAKIIGPINLPELRWLITTVEEFEDPTIYRPLGISDGEREKVLELIPPHGNVNEGVVTFLAAAWDIGVAQLDCRFAMLAGEGNFGTGVSLKGKVQNTLDFSLKGRLAVSTKPTPGISIVGKSHFTFGGLQIFDSEGVVLIKDEHFIIAGKFHLFDPVHSAVNVSGDIDAVISQTALSLKGRVNVDILKGIFSSESNIEIRNGNLWVKSSFLSQFVEFQVYTDPTVVRIDFNLASFFGLRNQLWISKDGKSVRGKINASVGSLSFSSDFNSINSTNTISGSCAFHLGAIKLLNGDINVSPDAFSLALKLDLPRTEISSFNSNLSGSINRYGFTVSGGWGLWLGLNFGGGLKVGIRGSGTLRLDGSGLTSSIEIQGELGLINLPKVVASSSFRIWYGRPCLLLAWNAYGISGGFNNLLAIALDGTGVTPRLEGDPYRWEVWKKHGGVCLSSGWKSWGDDIHLEWPHELRP